MLKGYVSLRLDSVKSENGFCVSFLNKLIQDLSDHGRCVQETEEFALSKDFDPSDLRLIC